MNDNLILPIIFILVVFASVGIIVYFFEAQNGKLYQLTIDRRNTDLDSLATILGDRLNNTFDIISSTSSLPTIMVPPKINLINKKLHGISQDDDMPRRTVAIDILRNVNDVETVRFLLPNGDMYMLEPYSNQINLKQDNFASFNYYKEAMITQKPYLSEVYQSQSTGHNTTVISAPVFSENGTLLGIWGGTIKLQFIQDYISAHYLGKTALVAVLDQYGDVVADTNHEILKNTTLKDLDISKKALNGETGNKFETIENKKMFVSYHPIKTPSSTWAMVAVRPYDESFVEYETAQDELYLMIVGVVTFVTIFGLYTRKTFHSSKKLIIELEKSQAKLKEQYEDVVRLSEKVTASEQKYRDLYEKSPDLLRSIDLNGIITDCNDAYAKSLGYSRNEAIGMSILDHTAEDSLTEMSSQFKEWKTSGNIINKDIWLKRKNGTTFPALLSGTNINDSVDKVIGRTVSLRDMTEIYNIQKTVEANNQRLQEQYQEMIELVKKLEDLNEKLRKEKEQSAKLAIIGERMSQINHNLRNPLNVIMGNAELMNMQSTKSEDENVIKKSKSIMIAADSMLVQIEELMSFIRGETLELDNKSLNQILGNAVNLVKIPQTVSIQLPEQDIVCKCDPNKLQVVLMNLFANAVEAIGNNGKITIRSRETKNEVVIEVEDSGQGIPNDILPKIFDPLFTTKKSGTGLGLPYCKNIIEQHGGTISVSTNPTVFTIVLPK
ncbi:MAG: ATP-binding protein [Candidatus Nitrosotalea sp.]|nr:ATP-binding protein [Candidatus Nitrosotalea sp.]